MKLLYKHHDRINNSNNHSHKPSPERTRYRQRSAPQRQALAREMESKHKKFMTKCFGKGSWQGTQEDMFYHALINLVKNGLTDEGVPALSGAYLNSYQRLMGILVQEVGTRSTPASEMVIKSFLAWEREIRKELTEPAWKVCGRAWPFFARANVEVFLVLEEAR